MGSPARCVLGSGLCVCMQAGTPRCVGQVDPAQAGTETAMASSQTIIIYDGGMFSSREPDRTRWFYIGFQTAVEFQATSLAKDGSMQDQPEVELSSQEAKTLLKHTSPEATGGYKMGITTQNKTGSYARLLVVIVSVFGQEECNCYNYV